MHGVVLCVVWCVVLCCVVCWWMYVGVSAVGFLSFYMKLNILRITGLSTDKKHIFRVFEKKCRATFGERSEPLTVGQSLEILNAVDAFMSLNPVTHPLEHIKTLIFPNDCPCV